MGMMIDKAIEHGKEQLEIFGGEHKEFIVCALDTMQKYQKIEQIKKDALYDIYMAGVNMAGEYQGCWVRFKDIENIVDEHFRKVLEDGNDRNN